MKRILSVALALALLVSFAACGGTEDVSNESNVNTNSVKTAADEALTALKNYDLEAIERYFKGSYFSEQTLQATGFEKAKTILSSFSWKLKDTSADNDDIYLTLDLSFVSLPDAMEKITNEIKEKSQNGEIVEDLDGYALARLQEMAADPETEKVTVPTEFIIKRVDDNWLITNGDILLTMFSVRAADVTDEK